MKIIVTGGAGFIGSHLVDRLIQEGHKVAVIDNLCTGRKENLNRKAKFYNLDIRDSKILGIFRKEKPEIVFHSAAQINVRKSVSDPIFDAKSNIIGSLNVINSFNESSKGFLGTRKFIFSSTGGAIYGDADIIPTPETYKEFPLSPYGICKLTVEKYLNYFYRITGLPYVSLRYANVYGHRQNSEGEAGVVAIFCDRMLQGKQPIINGDGTQTRDFVFVDDIIEANILAMQIKKTGIYNIGTAKETNINTIFTKLNNFLGKNFEKIHGPAQSGEQKRSCLDFTKAKNELGWHPKWSLDEGLEKTAEWFRSKSKIKNKNIKT